jgi:hypothetical protein
LSWHVGPNAAGAISVVGKPRVLPGVLLYVLGRCKVISCRKVTGLVETVRMCWRLCHLCAFKVEWSTPSICSTHRGEVAESFGGAVFGVELRLALCPYLEAIQQFVLFFSG